MLRRKALPTGTLVAGLAIFAVVACGQTPFQLYGVDFSPYSADQAPGVQISPAQIQAHLATISPFTKWVRTYSSLNGLDQVCPIAHSMGLKCAAGAAIYGTSSDAQELSSLISIVQGGSVDLAIVGTEALFRGNVSVTTLTSYIGQVRSAAPKVPVTTADTYSGLLDNASIFSAVDVVLVNIYPFYESIPLNHAVSWVNGWYQLVSNAAGSKQVIISETGWPSGGDAVGPSLPSPVNASSYFVDFVSWTRANSVSAFYFESFDEAWKISENTEGPHFGIWDDTGNMKPGMDSVFQGGTLSDNWSGNAIPGGAGSPVLTLTYVPPFGALSTQVYGTALHIRPADYKVACYIRAGTTWYVKPFASRPLTPILDDGTWACDSELNDGFAAFLLPNGTIPPLNLFGYPLLAGPSGSVASVFVNQRSTVSIAGSIQDSAGNGLDGITVYVSGSKSETTQTANGGKYSFIDLVAGSYTVTPLSTGDTFAPSSQNFPSLSSTQTANYTATSKLLSISGQIASQQGNALNGVQMHIIGASNSAASTDFFGNYAFTGLAPNATLSVVPSAPGYSFVPRLVDFAALTGDTSAYFTGTLTKLGDFNGDGVPDLVWQNNQTRDVNLWFMGGLQGTSFLSQTKIGSTPGWTLRAAADVNNDGIPDLFWQNDVTRDVTVWLMGGALGTDYVSQSELVATPGWTLRAVADMNGDGSPDLIWQNDTTRQVTVWFMGGVNSSTFLRQGLIGATPGWTLRVAVDLNKDGKPDLVWQNDATRAVAIWFMTGSDGTTYLSQASISAPGWTLSAAADLNGDGFTDLLWQNDATSQVTVWFMGGVQGVTYLGQSAIGTAPGWLLAPF